MENITAEEFLKEKVYITNDAEDGEEESVHDSIFNVKEALTEFAKMHVEKALIAASENSVKMSATKDTVRNAYDINSII